MWRNLIITFERSLNTTYRGITLSKGLKLNNFQNGNALTRLLMTATKLRNTETVRSEPRALEADTDYIVRYDEKDEKRISCEALIDALRTRFRLTAEDVEKILKNHEIIKSYKKKSLLNTLDILALAGVTKKNFVENSWLLTINDRRVSEKVGLLKSLNGLRDINDFIPFLRIQTPRLRKVVAALNQESKRIAQENRVFYLAEKLDVPVSVVTKYLAKRLFVLEMPFDMFQRNLQHMINYNVDSMSLLKDLWAFRYAPRAVELRLQRAQLAKKDKIMPWMVRCTEPILQKSLQLSLDEVEVLENKSTVAEYIGERLGFSPEDAQAIMNRHPQVNAVRVRKVKEVLDYLLLEEKFSRYDIAQVPRVLCHSLKTTRQRIEELKAMNCRPSSLIIVCRSQREYEKFVNSWRENYERIQKREATNQNDNDDHIDSEENQR